MSASLVGSEMCIRDRRKSSCRTTGAALTARRRKSRRTSRRRRPRGSSGWRSTRTRAPAAEAPRAPAGLRRPA
eukprot:7320478-Alexandrium_andersonii.AAC.1